LLLPRRLECEGKTPAACAQHQIADIGFSGSKVTIGGASQLGYQVWLGGDVGAGSLAQVVGRVAEQDTYAITGAIIGLWEAMRERGENFTTTVHRMGTETFAAQIAAVFKGQWEPGAEPSTDGPIFLGKPDRRQVRLVVGA
jgi:sulfite reductase beta subunit-like hemoprotein